MAAFSSFEQQQQQHPFNLDSSLFLPNINTLSMFDQVSFYNNNSSSSNTSMDHHHHEYSSSIVTDHHHKCNDNDDIITPKKPMANNIDKKKMIKKSKHPSSPNSAQSKEKKGKKKQKTMRNIDVLVVDEEKKAPTGYIHVRARRGQATDSHSLAERVRREKISERMKLLQSIVPGCDKVSGKALMLDEIINYVQSLQNQVEFLSMKLASVNPMYYDFGMDLESFIVSPGDHDQMQMQVQQDLSNSVALGSMQACSPTAASKHPHPLDTYFLFQQQAGSRQTLWEVDELRQNNIINNQSGSWSGSRSGSGSGIQQQPVFFPLI